MRFALTDRAGTTYRRTAEVPLTRVDPVADWGWPSNPWGQPRTCTSNTEGGWTSSVCQEWEEYYGLASGSTSGEPTVVAAAP